MILAAANGNVDIVRELLNYGADVNARRKVKHEITVQYSNMDPVINISDYRLMFLSV